MVSKFNRYIRPGGWQLPKPGIIGRAGRLLVGLYALYFVVEVLPNSVFLVNTPPSRSSFDSFLGVAAAFWLLPDVDTIGFHVRWGRRSQQLFLWLAGHDHVGVYTGISGCIAFASGSDWYPGL